MRASSQKKKKKKKPINVNELHIGENTTQSQVWWLTLLISALGRQRQAQISEFQDSQGYAEKPCLEKQKNKKTKKQNQNKTKQKNHKINKV